MAKTTEPKFGFKYLRKAGKEGKVKAYFTLLMPTEAVGTIELAGFKVIEGSRGLFISLPNRAVTGMKKQTVQTASGPVEGEVSETKYFNNIRFESPEKYKEFRDILASDVLPKITAELSK